MASSKLKVLIAASIYPPDPGGPATHAKKQFEWFNECGIKAEVVALAHYRQWPRWVRHLFYSFVLFLKSFGKDIVYAHDAWGVGFIAWVGARIQLAKFVLRVGGDMPWEKAVQNGQTFLSMKEWYERGEYKSDLFYKLSMFVLRRADLVIVPSPILKDLYTHFYGVREGKIKIIPNPISEFHFSHTAPEPTILYASRLVGYKNLDFVLRVLKRVFPKHPELKFLILGDGPERKHLEDLARGLKIEQRVVFKGTISQDEVLKETAKCLFTLAPALTEFNPNYVLQGLTLGKPFLISEENGLAFPVPKELQFSPRDEAELEARMEFLLDKDNYLKTQEELKKTVKPVTWEDNLGANIKALESLL